MDQVKRGNRLRHQPRGLPRRDSVTPEFVIASYHQLFQIEKSFRMSKSDLQARPVYHRKRDSIEAHLTIVLAALAVSRWIEARTGWSIRKFVKTARRYRTIKIQAGRQTLTAADPLPGRPPPSPRRHHPQQPRCAQVSANSGFGRSGSRRVSGRDVMVPHCPVSP
jgi:hypothetical protein